MKTCLFCDGTTFHTVCYNPKPGATEPTVSVCDKCGKEQVINIGNAPRMVVGILAERDALRAELASAKQEAERLRGELALVKSRFDSVLAEYAVQGEKLRAALAK